MTLSNLLRAALTTMAMLLPLCSGDLTAEEFGNGNGPENPPGSYTITSESGRVEIPFKLFRGDIWFLGRMNGQEVRMLIDNGFLWDPLLFFGSERVDSLGMVYDGEVDVSGGGDGDAVPSRTASGITISFPGIEFHDQTAVITTYDRDRSNPWEGCEGQVSATFLSHFVTEFDFDRMVITLTRPEEFRYRGGGVALPMSGSLDSARSIPATLEFDDGRVVDLDLAMDLGEGKPLYLIRDLEHGIELPAKTIESSLGFGMSGEILGHYGRVKSVTIGDYRLENVLAGFSARDYGGNYFDEATLGLALLDHFNFIYDYPHGMMYLEPNHRFDLPFEHTMTGMTTARGRDGISTVTRVYPDSPAADLGFEIGDRISHIDGKPVAEWSYWDLAPLLEREGRVITYTVLRKGGAEQVRLTLRRVI